MVRGGAGILIALRKEQALSKRCLFLFEKCLPVLLPSGNLIPQVLSQ